MWEVWPAYDQPVFRRTTESGGRGGPKAATGRRAVVRRTEPVTLELRKVETTQAGLVGPQSDDDFTPVLSEEAHLHVRMNNLPNGFSGRLELEVGRDTIKSSKAHTAGAAKRFTRLALIKAPVSKEGSPTDVKITWDGKATQRKARQYSNRTTKDIVSSKDLSIPIEAARAGQALSPGLYRINRISLIKPRKRRRGKTVAKLKPAAAGLSIPVVVNLKFNGDWTDDLKTFGLEPFSSEIKRALRNRGDRDFMVSDATVGNRVNARYVLEGTSSNRESIVVSVGGLHSRMGAFGTTPTGPAPLINNLFAIHAGLTKDIGVYPRAFLYFNSSPIAADKTAFQAAFGPLGVKAATTIPRSWNVGSAPQAVAATARAGGGKTAVTGACSSEDYDNVTVSVAADGTTTIVSTDQTKVPAARASAIQKAFNYFVSMVGNTINHEVGHAFGLVTMRRRANRIKIDRKSVSAPLDGDMGAHNKTGADTNIMDDGGSRSFRRRVEATGKQQRFSNSNMRYLRDCLPYDPNDD